MDLTLVAIALIALLAGAAVGWLVGRQGAGKAEGTVESLRMQLDAVSAERRDAVERRDAMQSELDALRAEKATFDARLADFERQKNELQNQFRELSDKALDRISKDFFEKAEKRFGEADKESSAKLSQLVDPIKKLLSEQAQKIDRVEKERVGAYSELKSLTQELRLGQGEVRDEARNLVMALRAQPKTRGRWGEKTLENVLEQAGLSQHADFATEVSVGGEEGRLRPDVVVNLPGGRKLVIDAKCSLNAYLDAYETTDDSERDRHLASHVASIRNHAQQLGSKSYWAQFEDAADYVVMFIPGEHFLTAALEKDQALWDWAFERKVLLATPTNLVAIARTVASVWRQEKLAAEAGQIAALGRELHNRIATMADHVAKMGNHLGRANDSYNRMVGSLESQVLTQARRFEDYGAGSAKEIVEAGQVETSPRSLTKLTSASDEDDQ
ncbi:DNA recombination protein RmuC [Sphingomicrobium sp. XHP0235]|uniref:DNA recombination protein RmuC n=1 Tax=Sphingomicrobium aquimarinum TaxID=3133971 RepID=UPI0031FF220E